MMAYGGICMEDRIVSWQADNSDGVRPLDRHWYEDFRFRKNIHGNPEVIYVSDGALEITIDGQSMEIPEGKFCMVLPWQVHAFETRTHSTSLVVVFPPRYTGDYMQRVGGCRSENQVFSADPDVRRLFLRHLGGETPSGELMISAVLLALCHCFSEECPLSPRDGHGKGADLYDVMLHVSDHCGEPITLRDVSDALGYSYYHLSHLFRDSVGMSFSRFLNMLRIERAAAKLGSGQSMTDIAFECGFASVRNFNRVFRALTGMTPSEYRTRRPTDSVVYARVFANGSLDSPQADSYNEEKTPANTMRGR